MYYGARWYDPSLGRFAQPDSIVPTSTQGTQAWDRYAYVNGNPVKYQDPTGHIMTGEGPTHFEFGIPTCSDYGATNYGGPLPCTYAGKKGSANRPVKPASKPTLSWPWSMLPPFNSRFQSGPVTIYDSNPNIIAVAVTAQQSLTVSNGSPITLRSDGQVIYSGRSGNMATTITSNGSAVTGFGVAAYDQLNEQVTDTTGFSFAPETLSASISQGTVTSIPGTGISLGSQTTLNVRITYNPLTLAGYGLLAGVGVLYAAGQYLAPLFEGAPAPELIPG